MENSYFISQNFKSQFKYLQTQFQLMIQQTILSLFFIFAMIFMYLCWIKPRNYMKFYENQLKFTKYTPKIFPYKLFYNRLLASFQVGKKVGDPLLYSRTQFPKCDIVISNIMNTPFIQIGHIDFLKSYFQTDKHYDYPKHYLITDPLLKVLGPSISMTQGSFWKQKRSFLNKMFNFEFVKNQAFNVAQICDRCIKEMEQKATKGQNQQGQYVECHLLYDLLTNIFSSVIIKSFIGLNDKYEIDGEDLVKYFLTLIDEIGQHRLFSPTAVLGNTFYDLELRDVDKVINQKQKKLKQWGKNLIQKQRNKIQAQLREKKNDRKENDNLFKAFIAYKKQNNISDQVISNEDILGSFFGFIFAGTDSTSNFLNYIICQIARNPEIQKQLRREIEENLKDNDYSYENLKNFKYIDALQKETSRLYGPLNNLILRVANKDNYLNGLAIKKGTIISINFFGNHCSEKYFKQPLQFRPQRWLNGQCDGLDPFMLIGFSAGARACLGKQLSLLQSKIALIKIMKRYKKITLGKEDFKWKLKLFTVPEYFKTKLTISEQ